MRSPNNLEGDEKNDNEVWRIFNDECGVICGNELILASLRSELRKNVQAKQTINSIVNEKVQF